MKTCSKCGCEKPENEFHLKGRGVERHTQCKACYRDRILTPGRAREARIARMRKRRTGYEPAEYERMVVEQNGLCYICSEPPLEGHGLHADHDHATGLPRRPLCLRCNMTIGAYNDDPALLRALADYVEGSYLAKSVTPEV